jgi:NitT/TauT family transport system permease protein
MSFGIFETDYSVPTLFQDSARMFHLSAWQRFWRIDVPFSMPSLLWNTMASMSAGWFFVVASEAITVSNQNILLPGIGSYIAVAIQAADLRAITYAILAMLIVILIYDQLLFRPLVAWAERFKTDKEGPGTDYIAESWVIDLFSRTRLLRRLGKWLALLFDRFVNIRLFAGLGQKAQEFGGSSAKPSLWKAVLYHFVLISVGAMSLLFLWEYIGYNISLPEIFQVFVLGLITAFRVMVMIFLCSLIWVPIGVWIGLRPRAAAWAQPVAQVLAAFPANLLYPFIVVFIVTYHLSPNVWLTPLMILGSQWYILFNVVAGASRMPKDLLQVADNFCVTGWQRWRRLLLPSIFPYYVTGAITAAGGAWNASIVAEVASWGGERLVATGLGAYITQYTAQGNFPHIALGIGMMCLLVLLFNRIVWRPLYIYSVSRFLLE